MLPLCVRVIGAFPTGSLSQKYKKTNVQNDLKLIRQLISNEDDALEAKKNFNSNKQLRVGPQL